MRGFVAVPVVIAAGLALFAGAAAVSFLERSGGPEGPATLVEWAARAVRPAGPLPSGRGAELVARYRCLVCHTLDGRGAHVGPVLNGVRERKTRAEIIRWLDDPQAVKPGTIMPTFHFTPVEEELLADYLLTK
jgi:cytochrome c oxidase subunit 2